MIHRARCADRARPRRSSLPWTGARRAGPGRLRVADERGGPSLAAGHDVLRFPAGVGDPPLVRTRARPGAARRRRRTTWPVGPSSASEASRRLVAAAGIDTFLVDTGLRDGRLCTSPIELWPAGPRTRSCGWRRWPRICCAPAAGCRLRRAGRAGDCAIPRAVGLKSVAAYRVGLDLPVRAALDGCVALGDALAEADPASHRPSGGPRLARLDGDRERSAAAVPRRVRRCRPRSPPSRSAAADGIPAGDRGARSAGAAAAQLPVPPPGGLSGAGLQPRLRRRRPGRPQLRRAEPTGDRRDARGGAVRQAAVLHRRVRAGRALLPRCPALPPRPLGRVDRLWSTPTR